MLRLTAVIALILFGLSRPAQALPTEMSAVVLQLADVTGVLSSRSCRDGAEAGRAARALSHMLREAKRLKHLDYAAERRFRQHRIVPYIQARRRVTHSSSDCAKARELLAGAVKDWNIVLPVQTASGGERQSIGDPADGSLPAAPILGATRSDVLAPARSRK